MLLLAGAKEGEFQAGECVRNKTAHIVLIRRIGKTHDDKIVALRQNCFRDIGWSLAYDHAANSVFLLLSRYVQTVRLAACVPSACKINNYALLQIPEE